MKDETRKDTEPQDSAKSSVQKANVPLQPAGEAVVNLEEAAKPSPGKQIHGRRPLPRVPEARSKENAEGRTTDETDDITP